MRKMLLAPLLMMALVAACRSEPALAPDVEDTVERALEARGLKDVSVGQDREKGIVTLTGKVQNEAQKAEAASIAQSIAGSQVVANQIAVEPAGNEGVASDVNEALDDGIDSNMKALLLKVTNKDNKDDVTYSVKNAVVTLKGSVASQARRTEIEQAAAGVPNVKQVVNELEVKGQRATTRGGGGGND